MQTKNLLLTLFIPLLFSCKKEILHDSAPSLVGTWKHYTSESAWHIITINENSNGRMEWYVDNKFYKDTKTRTWYLKNNTIYFGKVALNGELYEVIDFPITASTEAIELFDTLKVGKRYMKLDKGIYVEQ